MSKSEKSTLSPGDEGDSDPRAKRPYQEQRLHYGQRLQWQRHTSLAVVASTCGQAARPAKLPPSDSKFEV
jgi:hypothetical protein